MGVLYYLGSRVYIRGYLSWTPWTFVEAGVALPGEEGVGGVHDLQVPDAERSLAEGRPHTWAGHGLGFRV